MPLVMTAVTVSPELPRVLTRDAGVICDSNVLPRTDLTTELFNAIAPSANNMGRAYEMDLISSASRSCRLPIAW